MHICVTRPNEFVTWPELSPKMLISQTMSHSSPLLLMTQLKTRQLPLVLVGPITEWWNTAGHHLVLPSYNKRHGEKLCHITQIWSMKLNFMDHICVIYDMSVNILIMLIPTAIQKNMKYLMTNIVENLYNNTMVALGVSIMHEGYMTIYVCVKP